MACQIKIPCDGCITLAMCIIRFSNEFVLPYRTIIECPIVEKYLKDNEWYRYTRIQYIKEFFEKFTENK